MAVVALAAIGISLMYPGLAPGRCPAERREPNAYARAGVRRWMFVGLVIHVCVRGEAWL